MHTYTECAKGWKYIKALIIIFLNKAGMPDQLTMNYIHHRRHSPIILTNILPRAKNIIRQ